MILIRKGTCAPVPPLSKGRGDSAPVMHPRFGVPVRKSTKMLSHAVAHYRIGVCTCPALRGAKHFSSTCYFLYACLNGLYTLHTNLFFTTQKRWWDANPETIHQQLLPLVSIMQECWVIEEKWRFVKSIILVCCIAKSIWS